MVDLFGRYIDTVLQALLTHRMACSIAVPDSFPCSSIPAFDGRVTFISFIAFVLFLLMCLTEPAIGQVRTAGVRAWPFGPSRHCPHLHPVKTKTSGLLSQEVFYHIFFDTNIIPIKVLPFYAKVCQSVSTFILVQKNDAEQLNEYDARCVQTHLTAHRFPPMIGYPDICT